MTKPKARRGSGTVFFDERRNEWVGSVSLGRDAAGKRLRRTVYGASKKVVQQKLADLRSRLGEDLKTPKGSLRFATFAEDWLSREVAQNRRATTERFYRLIVERYLNPQLGRKYLAEIQPADVERTVAIARELRSASMASKVRSALGRIMRRAVALGLAEKNPVAATEAPRVQAKTMRFLEPAMVRRFLAAAKGDRFEALFVLLATSGLRIGEALALRWDDVDLTARELRVNKTLVDNTGPLRVNEPKTVAGRRTIALTAQAAHALELRLAAAKAEGYARKTDPIFCTTAGTYPRRKNVADRHFRPILERAKLPAIRLHDLRHSSAVLSIAAGTSPRTLSERLGHTSAAFTMRTYGHATSDLLRQDAEAIDKLLSDPEE